MTESTDPTVHHDPSTHRFRITLDGGESYLAYRPVGDDRLDFRSTFTSPSLRGRGLAARVVAAGFEHAREHGLTVIPSCPYVGAFIDEHPEYADLLAESA